MYDLWLSEVLGPNCINSKEIIDLKISPEKLYENRNNWIRYGCFTNRQIKKAKDISLADISNIFKEHRKNDIKSFNYLDECYPDKFKNISHPPIILFYKGDITLLKSQCTISVIGSRHCNGEGERACELLCRDICDNGGVIVSGLAQGVDCIANKTCVENNGKTIAILGVPLDECYPKSNIYLQKVIEKDHLAISEYHSNYKYYSANFVYRNRIIAALCDALCVIQAGEKSGTLTTVKRAIEYDKPVFAVPGSIFSPNCKGTNELLTDGIAMAATNGIQILNYLGFKSSNNTKHIESEKYELDLSDIALEVLNNIDGAMFTADIIRKTGLSVGIVKAALTELEINALVSRQESGEYIKN